MENMQPNGLQVSNNTTKSAADAMADAIFDDNAVIPLVESGATLNQQSFEGEQQMIDQSIDPKYAHLNKEEALIRTLQSKYDSTTAQFEKVKPMLEKYELLEKFVNDLYQDEQTLYAFLNEVKPELAKPLQGNFETYAKTKLTEEFGEGFEPDQELARRGDPTHFRYFKKMEELYNEFNQGSTGRAKSLKELRDKRIQQEEYSRQEQLKEINSLKQKYNVDDGQVKNFISWAQNLKAENLFDMYRALSRVPNIPQTSQLSGTAPTPNRIDDILSFLK